MTYTELIDHSIEASQINFQAKCLITERKEGEEKKEKAHTILKIVCDLLLRAFILVSPKCLLAAGKKNQSISPRNNVLISCNFDLVLIQDQTFSKLDKLKHLVSTVYNFLP